MHKILTAYELKWCLCISLQDSSDNVKDIWVITGWANYFLPVFVEHHLSGNSFLYARNICFIFFLLWRESNALEKYTKVLPWDFLHVFLRWFDELWESEKFSKKNVLIFLKNFVNSKLNKIETQNFRNYSNLSS